MQHCLVSLKRARYFQLGLPSHTLKFARIFSRNHREMLQDDASERERQPLLRERDKKIGNWLLLGSMFSLVGIGLVLFVGRASGVGRIEPIISKSLSAISLNIA